MLTNVVNKIIAGEFSTNASLLLSAATLILLDKGARKIRPIAIGIVLRRLVTKALMPKAIAEAKELLLLLKVGYGVKCGADAMVHDARTFIEERGNDTAFILTSADA